ncbi:MAG TPA: hypothetical protein VKB68_08665 [Stellaceae bacterium]|nr:hypothetical protein [Stellaceae bacterium]
MSAESDMMAAPGVVPVSFKSPAALSPLWVGAAIYGLLLVVGERLLNDPDTYWHIATGRWIWAHAAVPTTDPFSHTLAGAPWHAHEWLSELIIAGAYGTLGWAGVVALGALAVAASLALLMRALARLARPTVALGATAMAFFLMAAHLMARPHALALPILVAWAAALIRARDEAQAPSLRLLPLMALWANMHGGFVIGLGLACALALETVLAAEGARERRVAIWRWGQFIGGAALASVLTPQGIAGWWFPFKLMSFGFGLDFVGEWHAPALGPFHPLVLWLAALIAFTLASGLRAPLFRVLMVATLVTMALSRTRNAELLAMLGPLLLAGFVPTSLRPASPSLSAPEGRRGVRQSVAVLLVFIAATGAAVIRGYAHENLAIAPSSALTAARQAGLTGPVFNDYDFGGYLIFEGVAPFVDGRIDLYGDDFMRAYAAALGAEDDVLPPLLDRYRIAWTLLKPGEPAAAALDRDPAWERTYADENAVVHRRR